MHKTTNFTIWHLCAVVFQTFFTFLSLTACLIHEYVMLENKFLGVLRARTKLTEQLSYSEPFY